MRLRGHIYTLLEVAQEGDRASRIIDLALVVLIAANIVAVIAETEPGLSAYSNLFRLFEIVSVAIFSVEYILRLWSCPEQREYSLERMSRLRFAARGMMIIDLLAILPFYLGLLVPAVRVVDLRFLRTLRLIRVFRIFKLARYSSAMRLLGCVLKAKKEELGIAVVVVLILLILASSLMYFVEHAAQPEVFPSISAAMWWGVATLTTVGYGDVVPVTAPGKLLGTIVAVLGIGLFALPAGILASGFAAELERDEASKLRCPHCGRKIKED